MIVLDASVLSNAIADDGADGRPARSELRAAIDIMADPTRLCELNLTVRDN